MSSRAWPPRQEENAKGNEIEYMERRVEESIRWQGGRSKEESQHGRKKMIAKKMVKVADTLPSLGRNNNALELSAGDLTGTRKESYGTISIERGRRGNSAFCYS